MTQPPQFGAWSQVDQERKVGTPELTPPGTVPILTNIYQCSAEFLNQFRFWLEQNPPTIPISNIPGFSQFTAQAATAIATSETVTTTTYNDLTTVGPQLTLLPDGKYVFFFGGLATNNGLFKNYMGLKINTTDAADVDAAITYGANPVPGTLAIVKTLSNAGNNTVTCRYRTETGGGSSTFANRWLIAFRYANA